MNDAVKWIGGASALVVAGFAALVLMTDDPPPPNPLPARAQGALPPVTPPTTAAAASPSSVFTPSAAPSDSPFVVKRVLPITGPIKYGEWHWDEEGVPDGPLVITVDLEARVVSVFRNGYEIGAAAAMLGTDDHPTPLGTFPILRKSRHYQSRTYNNAPMPWSLWLTNDGIAMHGGAEVENGYASHGCVAIPNGLASRLFEVANVGDKVIITRGAKLGIGQSIL